MYMSIWRFSGDPYDLLRRYDAMVADVPTQNLRLTGSQNIPDSGLVINALSLRGTFDTGFNLGTDLLNLVSGGLIAKPMFER